MRCAVFAGLIFGFSLSLSARANGADLLPGVGFSATSTPVAPCGTGTPPRGHFPPEIALADRPNGVTLTVRQGDQRLCYVAGDNAEAPVLRVRQGQEMTVTLRNEITDPKAIADFIPIKQLDAPNDAVPAGLYWYHPHIHGEVQAQMLMGLSGAIVVEGREDDARHAAGIEDRIFVIRQTQDLDGVESDEDTPKVPSATGAPQGPAPAGLGGVLETAHEVGCSNHTGIDELTLNGARVADGRAPDSELAPVDITA